MVRRKAIVISLVASALVATAIVLSLNSLIEKNRDRIGEELERSLGRAVSFDRLRLSFRGGLALSAQNLRVAEDPYYAATPFIQTKELGMQLRLLPLFRGRMEIKKLILDEPEIQIIRNERGHLNIEALTGAARIWDKVGKPRDLAQPAPLSLLISAVRVDKGRIDYIDRSQKEPVEIPIRNLSVNLWGLGFSGPTRLNLSANLFEDHRQNLSLEGSVELSQDPRQWTRYPADLRLRIDSLYLPQLTRAVPKLREILLLDLGVTGPLRLNARLVSKAGRTRITDLTVTGPFFGAAENNVSVSGELDFSKADSWREPEIKGKISAEAVSLKDLRKIRPLMRFVPGELSSEGPLSITSELKGRLNELKAYLRIQGQESEIQLGNWLRKARGIPAEMELRLARRKDRVVLEESSLTIHNSKLYFSGSFDEWPERRLLLRLRTDKVELAGWDRLLVPLSPYTIAGSLRWDLSIRKILGLSDGLDVEGTLELRDILAKEKKSGWSIDKLSAEVSLHGKEARIESGEGLWQEIPFRNLKGELRWTPDGVSFKNFSFHALGGTFQSSGLWGLGEKQPRRVTLESRIDAVDLKSLVARHFPKVKEHIDGRLDFELRLRGEGGNGFALQGNLRGEGKTEVRNGTLRDFNLVEMVLSRVPRLPGIPQPLSWRIPARYSDLLKRKETPFDTLRATFKLEGKGVRTEEFLLATPDYSINGQGWIGFDKAMKWTAVLVMSSQFTQELIREHRNARYIVNQEGRLAIPFRVEGTLPHVQPKPDVQRLAEAIQKGLLRKGAERDPRKEEEKKKREKRDWIQKGLEQLLGK